MMDAWLSSSRDDRVLLVEQGLEDAPVGVEAGRVQDRVVGLQELGQRRSSCLWISWVPQMNRTLAMP